MSNETPEEESKDLISSDSTNTTSVQNKSTIVEETIEGFLMSMQNTNPNSSLLNGLNSEQIDKVLKSADDSDKRRHEYDMAELNASKELEKDRISGQQIEKKTRKIAILSLISAFVIITLIILIYKERYVQTWFTLVLGLIGGSGLTALWNNFENNTRSKE